MALTDRSIIGQITVLPDGQLQVRQDIVIELDGVEIARTFHRHVVAPGDSLGNEDVRVASIARLLHTPPVVASYRSNLAAASVGGE